MSYDAIVIGSGPNGLAAAVTLAQAGRRVVVFEGRETIGGGMRSAELTLPGFVHDICSAVHPLGISSPFFRTLPLAQHGLEWVQPDLPVGHPLDGDTAVFLARSIDETAATLGPDAPAYRALMAPFVEEWETIAQAILGPLTVPRVANMLRHPFILARFGLQALRSARGLAESRFRTVSARALFAGLAAHAIMPLERPVTAAFGLVLGALGHAVGWPLPRGGSQRIADALAAHFRSLGGEIVTGRFITSLDDLPPARAILCDTSPRTLLRLAGERLPAAYRRRLQSYRYGPGVFKIDWALSEPIPWQAEPCRRAGTIHLGPTFDHISRSEREATEGRHSDAPYVLVVQQSLFDDSRAPAGKHTAWAYCHVPHGSPVDMTAVIENQLARFAPGFRDTILARHTMNALEMEAYNPNYVGGDINSGVQDLRQFFTRPAPRLVPYTTPLPNLFICSSATPPGGGVHGMCGYHAAQAVLSRLS